MNASDTSYTAGNALRRMRLEVSFTSAGWFNATMAAKFRSKEPAAWIFKGDTVRYIAALQRASGNSVAATEFIEINNLPDSTSKRSKLSALVKSTGLVRKKGGSSINGGGTWLHPKLAVPFARWLDDDFALWCDTQIDAIISGDRVAAAPTPFVSRVLSRGEPALVVIAAEDEIAAKGAKIAADAPKVKFAEAVRDTDASNTLNEVPKTLRSGATRS